MKFRTFLYFPFLLRPKIRKIDFSPSEQGTYYSKLPRVIISCEFTKNFFQSFENWDLYFP
eukprot:UN19231